MRLQYTAVGIQNVSRMAVTRDDYMRDIENLALSMRYAGSGTAVSTCRSG